MITDKNHIKGFDITFYPTLCYHEFDDNTLTLYYENIDEFDKVGKIPLNNIVKYHQIDNVKAKEIQAYMDELVDNFVEGDVTLMKNQPLNINFAEAEDIIEDLDDIVGIEIDNFNFIEIEDEVYPYYDGLEWTQSQRYTYIADKLCLSKFDAHYRYNHYYNNGGVMFFIEEIQKWNHLEILPDDIYVYFHNKYHIDMENECLDLGFEFKVIDLINVKNIKDLEVLIREKY